ncbi:mitochondrial carrier domain-containing protein [Podospora australis]|uniref:Eukaryotic translation initiation factor 2 subunit alpha n=1 Tax=Podospora australis TaxID=1536484 RepID=A0AAN6X6N3_9PEZI|nr:mitochondrial carrier domain-containing protein [Podospora australis]
MSLSNCRFYEEKYPEIDSFVMVNVKQIADMGAYVKLLEYDNIDGMILLSELSRRRIRSIQKLIRVGRNEVVVVLRVDKEKGYIDLSKRRVSPEDIVRCEERYNKSKIVHSIMRHVAEKTLTPIESLYETIGWPLNKKYGHSLDAFKLSITNPDVWNDIQFPNEQSAEELKSYIAKRLTPQPIKVRADIEVTCFAYEGIDAIKRALRTAEARNTEDSKVKCRLVSPPLFVLTNTCLDKNAGIARLQEAIVDVRESIQAAGGNLVVKMEPKAVTESDDAELQALMEKRERENAEVSGDEDRFSHYLVRYATWLPPFMWFNSYVAEVTFINGPSMYPFFNPSYNESLRRDLCLVWKYNAQQDLKRGEVVVFRSPNDPKKIAVKRIVGLEGEVIKTRGTYPYPLAAVPEGHVWVEGDNGDKSRDSNYYGPISVRLVTGRVTHILSPHKASPRMSISNPNRTFTCMLAGGLGGTSGDMLMHSLDTVKTRQQGDPHIPPRYTSLGSSYYKIIRQEGIRRGLYGGWLPALAGSFPGTLLFFGSYEWSKRNMIDNGVQPHLAYLTAGFVGDFVASIVYVPSEVIKTRLQLQGRYNNPYFDSGYNYRGTTDALRTIVRTEGLSALFHGYGATLWRDLPYSALQFMFYEQGQIWAREWKKSKDIGWEMELLTGAAAGGLAGTMTCPLDVVKTRLQTQLHPEAEAAAAAATQQSSTSKPSTIKDGQKTAKATAETSTQKLQKRLISTSSPSTHTPRPGAVTLNTSSILRQLESYMPAERREVA